MIGTSIKCDACESDLTYTGNSVDYYLAVSSVSKLPWYTKDGGDSGLVTDMAIPLPIERAMQFCGLGCFMDWAEKQKIYRRPRPFSPTPSSDKQ